LYIFSKCLGFVYVESVENITKLFMNPPIVEVENFMDE
jgi:hypothetical protein